MGWLDVIDGYPVDDSQGLLNQEKDILYACQTIIKELTGQDKDISEIANMDCEFECPARSRCPLINKQEGESKS